MAEAQYMMCRMTVGDLC